MLGWISRINQRLPPSSYEDPHGDMPVDDEDMPPPQAQQPEPDLDDDPIELNTAGDPPSQPPAQVPVPEGEEYSTSSGATLQRRANPAVESSAQLRARYPQAHLQGDGHRRLLLRGRASPCLQP